jgi:hypothetical protein
MKGWRRLLGILGNSIYCPRNSDRLFDADGLDVGVAGLEALVGSPHDIGWGAQDRGALALGLLDNLALGSRNLGNGWGLAKSDAFRFEAGSVLYVFGLVIESDATVDLNGSTLYYPGGGLGRRHRRNRFCRPRTLDQWPDPRDRRRPRGRARPGGPAAPGPGPGGAGAARDATRSLAAPHP